MVVVPREYTHTHTHDDDDEESPIFSVQHFWGLSERSERELAGLDGYFWNSTGCAWIYGGVFRCVFQKIQLFPFSFYLLLHFPTPKRSTLFFFFFFFFFFFSAVDFLKENFSGLRIKKDENKNKNIHPASPSQQIFPGYRNSQRRI
jgi:hypothetical protein